MQWGEFGRSGGADVGTLSPVLPSVLLCGGAGGDRAAEQCVCVYVCVIWGQKKKSQHKYAQKYTGMQADTDK